MKRWRTLAQQQGEGIPAGRTRSRRLRLVLLSVPSLVLGTLYLIGVSTEGSDKVEREQCNLDRFMQSGGVALLDESDMNALAQDPLCASIVAEARERDKKLLQQFQDQELWDWLLRNCWPDYSIHPRCSEVRELRKKDTTPPSGQRFQDDRGNYPDDDPYDDGPIYDPPEGMCIGDCNDEDGDGRTWDDVDADNDGRYEHN